MKTYKENGVYVLEADPGKTLYNATLDVYADKIRSERGVKMTDWVEISTAGIVIKTDAELLEMFQDDILGSIDIQRGTKKLTSMSVDYIYDPGEHKIIEIYS